MSGSRNNLQIAEIVQNCANFRHKLGKHEKKCANFMHEGGNMGKVSEKFAANSSKQCELHLNLTDDCMGGEI